jgi:hypothetical protein
MVVASEGSLLSVVQFELDAVARRLYFLNPLQTLRRPANQDGQLRPNETQ